MITARHGWKVTCGWAAATALCGFLFWHSVEHAKFKTIDRWWTSFAIDWWRFATFTAFAVCACALAWRVWFGRGPLRRNLFASLAALLAAIWLFELTLRLSTTRYYWFGTYTVNNALGFYEHDPVVGFRGKTNGKSRHKDYEFSADIRGNELGFRDDALPTTDPARTRVLFVGDSFFWGWGVAPLEQRCDRRAQAHLKERGIDIDTINASVPGYGTDQEYLVLQELLPRCLPKVVVLQFCQNDVEGNNATTAYGESKGFFTLDEGGKLVLRAHDGSVLGSGEPGNWPLKAAPPTTSPQPAMDEADKADTVGEADEVDRAEAPTVSTSSTAPTLSTAAITTAPVDPSQPSVWASGREWLRLTCLKSSHVFRWLTYRYYKTGWRRFFEAEYVDDGMRAEKPNDMAEWRLTLALISACDRACRQYGAQLIVLVTPENYPVRFNSALHFRDVVPAYCREQGIACIDGHVNADGAPFDFARDRFVMDGHWNARGHDQIGRSMARAIEECLKGAKPN